MPPLYERLQTATTDSNNKNDTLTSPNTPKQEHTSAAQSATPPAQQAHRHRRQCDVKCTLRHSGKTGCPGEQSNKPAKYSRSVAERMGVLNQQPKETQQQAGQGGPTWQAKHKHHCCLLSWAALAAVVLSFPLTLSGTPLCNHTHRHTQCNLLTHKPAHTSRSV